MTKQEIVSKLALSVETADNILSHIEGDQVTLARDLIATIFDDLATEINDDYLVKPIEDECRDCVEERCCDEDAPDEYLFAVPPGATVTIQLPKESR